MKKFPSDAERARLAADAQSAAGDLPGFENAPADAVTVLVEAVPGKSIVVTQVAMVCGDTATDATFISQAPAVGEDPPVDTEISSVYQNAVRSGAILNHSYGGWFRTQPGSALAISCGAGSITGVTFSYRLQS